MVSCECCTSIHDLEHNVVYTLSSLLGQSCLTWGSARARLCMGANKEIVAVNSFLGDKKHVWSVAAVRANTWFIPLSSSTVEDETSCKKSLQYFYSVDVSQMTFLSYRLLVFWMWQHSQHLSSGSWHETQFLHTPLQIIESHTGLGWKEP